MNMQDKKALKNAHPGNRYELKSININIYEIC